MLGISFCFFESIMRLHFCTLKGDRYGFYGHNNGYTIYSIFILQLLSETIVFSRKTALVSTMTSVAKLL